MSLPYAARFAATVILLATLYTLLVIRPGIRIIGVLTPRQLWILDHPFQWQLGWWLWLVTIFSWMVLLVVLSWHYLPAHRVAGALQSGVMVIAAVLLIAGVTVWMGLLPVALAQFTEAALLTPLLDALALGLLGAGLMMAGAVTTWLVVDLMRLSVLSRAWLAPLAFAGLCLLPSPFLLPNPYLLLAGALCWLIGCGWLATRPRLPSPFVEWPEQKESSGL